MPVVGLGIFAVLLNALRNAQGINKEHLWLCLSGCFQRGFIKEGRPRVNAGRDILWAGVHPWLNDKEPAWSQMSASLYLSVSWLRILRSHWSHAPDSFLHWWPLSCWLRSRAPASPSSFKLLLVRFLVTVMGKITVLKWASSKVTGFSTAQITDQKSHLSWVNTHKATAAICAMTSKGSRNYTGLKKSTRELFRGRSWHTEVGNMK